MLPEAKICWFCAHMHEEWRTDGRHRWVRTCDLGLKQVGARHFVDFSLCKGFEPNSAAIDKRMSELHDVIRRCRVELGYLNRLGVYADHRRRAGAFYKRECILYEPMIREAETEDEKTARACGFEEQKIENQRKEEEHD